ncbi:MAG: hypothetical protein KGL39_26400 [Patescibacteria group bacterium]|nr:hypothetical protein [Patescibacteria group bacterium]
MKTILYLILLLTCMNSFADGLQLIDLTTQHTNYYQFDGYTWISHTATNQTITLVVSNRISTGDSPIDAWSKVNSNFTYLAEQTTNISNYAASNYVSQNVPFSVLTTNLYPGASNYLGTVPGFYSYTLTQITNCDPLYVWYELASMTGTNINPADAFDYGTNGYWVLVTNTIPTNMVWLSLATTNSIAQSGQLAWLSVNGTQVYSNYTTSPQLIDLFNLTTNFTLNQFTNFSPVDLYGSGDNTNYWPIASSYPTTNLLHLALVAETNSPAPGAFTSLNVLDLPHHELVGKKLWFPLQGIVSDTTDSNTASIASLSANFGIISNAFSSFTNWPQLTFRTISSNTATTEGHGAGFIAWSTDSGTNYLNITLGTNLWGRVGLITNWP